MIHDHNELTKDERTVNGRVEFRFDPMDKVKERLFSIRHYANDISGPNITIAKAE